MVQPPADLDMQNAPVYVDEYRGPTVGWVRNYDIPPTGDVNLGTISSGTVTINPSIQPLQHLVNNGAFTIALTTDSGATLLEVVNGASAGTITFSGFVVGVNTGHSIDTVSGHVFYIKLWQINGIAGYFVQGAQ